MTAKGMTAAMVTSALEATASKISAKDADPFRAGDTVVYPAHGVGKIDSVGFEVISGHRLNLIHISFEDSQMTLRIPVVQARAAGLRRLANQEQLREALDRLKARRRVSRLMWARRAQEYLAKINSGELGLLAEAVRDLQAGEDGSGGSSAQRNLFELALDRLAGEHAAINGTSRVEAIAQLTQALLETRAKAHRPEPQREDLMVIR